MNPKKLFLILIFVLSIVLSFSLFIFKDFFIQARSWGLLGIFVVNAVSNASFFVSGPAFLTVVAGGSLYNPFFVAIVSSLGSSVGEMVGYLFGLSGRKALNHRLNKKIWFIVLERYFHKYGGWILFFFAFIPNFIFDSFGVFAGVFAYSPWKFFLIVTLGRFIRFLILAILGSKI